MGSWPMDMHSRPAFIVLLLVIDMYFDYYYNFDIL